MSREHSWVVLSTGSGRRFGPPAAPSLRLLTIASLVAVLVSPVLAQEFTAANEAQFEGDSGTAAMEFTVSLNTCPLPACQVQVSVTSDTATLHDDFLSLNVVLNFPPSAAAVSKLVSVSIKGDTFLEHDESFDLRLRPIVPSQLRFTAARGTILNDEFGSIRIISTSAIESGNARFDVRLALASGDILSENIELEYQTVDGTATVADSDYQSTAASVFFGLPTQTRQVNVSVTPDSKVELDETFHLDLLGITPDYNGILIIDSGGTVTIPNDDTANVFFSSSPVQVLEGDTGTTAFDFTVTLDQNVDSTVDVNYATMDDTALVSDSDYVSASGSITLSGNAFESETVTILVNGDQQIESDEQFKVLLSNLGASGRSVVFSPENPQMIGTILDDDACQLSDHVLVHDVTYTNMQLIEACLTVTVGPNVFVDAPSGFVTIRAGERVAVSEISVQAGAVLRIEVDPAAVLP